MLPKHHLLPATALLVLPLQGLAQQEPMPAPQQAPQQQAPQTQQQPSGQAPQQQPQEQQQAPQQPQQREEEQTFPRQSAPADGATGPGGAAPEDDVLEDGGPVVQVYANDDDALDVTLGLGGRIEGGVGYLYISHFQTEGRGGRRSGSSDGAPDSLINDYRSTRFGLYAEGHEVETGDGMGFGLFLYNNRSDFVIDRSGLGTTLDAAYVIADRVRLSAGADLMPFFLSTDWGADAQLEYEWHADIRLLVHPQVDVGLNWRAGRTNDRSLSTNQYEEVMLGLRITF